MEMISNLFNEFGTFGPMILIFLSINLLWNKQNLFFYYIVGVFIDNILNLILKGLIQQPRPSIEQKSFDLVFKYGKHILFKDGIPFNIYGMPSGHSQSVFFSTAFIYLSLKKNNITYAYLGISLLTMIQRVVYNHHTVPHVIVGALVGSAVGYLFYYLSTEKVKGLIREKLDDFGPI
jgi:membrane-associated phospholipid phosphatase